VREAADHLLNGGSLGALVRGWAARGVTTTTGRPWSRTNLRDMMLRPKPGVLADRDTRRLRALFEGLSTGKGREKRAKRLLTGLLVCGACGRAMKSRAPYYVCDHGGTVHLKVIARPVDLKVLREAAGMWVPEPEALADPMDPLLARVAEIDARLEELAAEFAQGSTFAAAAAKALEAEKLSLEEQIEEGPEGPVDQGAGMELELDYHGGPRRLHEMIVAGTIAAPEVRAWLERLVDHVTVRPGGRGADRAEVAWRRGVVARPEEA
jgi:hypothetical protein